MARYSKTNEMGDVFTLLGELTTEIGEIDFAKANRDDIIGLKGAVNAAIRQVKYVKNENMKREL